MLSTEATERRPVTIPPTPAGAAAEVWAKERASSTESWS
jgi:hypothetical protein